jgi:thiosulfate sulfurtransferase
MEMSKDQTASSVTVAQLKKLLQENSNLMILDVRRAPAFEKNPVLITSARRTTPDSVSLWAAETEFLNATVVAYCVYGHEVSQGAAQTLRKLGVNAFFLEGGLVEWQESGGAVSVTS